MKPIMFYVALALLCFDPSRLVSQVTSEMQCGSMHTENPAYSPASQLSRNSTTQFSSTKYIRVAFHYMLPDTAPHKIEIESAPIHYDGAGNFTETDDGMGNTNYSGYQFASDILNNANFELANPAAQHRQEEGQFYPDPPSPVKIQYVLAGVYFHRDSYFYQYATALHRRDDTNEKFGLDPHSVINVYITPQMHTDGLTPIQGGDMKWVFLRLYDKYSDPSKREWTIAKFGPSLLNHEIGHTLSLSHTWDEDDLCQDTPPGALYLRKEKPKIHGEGGCSLDQANCWSYSTQTTQCGDSPCSNWDNISNNIMDYNSAFPHAFTPCQIMRMHEDLEGPGRQYVYIEDAFPPAMPILIVKAITHCSQQSVRIGLDGSLSSSVEEYRLSITDDHAGAIFNSGWVAGEPGILDVNQSVRFKTGRTYNFTLDVRNSNGRRHISTSNQVAIPSCPDEANEISLRTLPSFDEELHYEINCETSVKVSGHIGSTNGDFSRILFVDKPLGEGQWLFAENASDLPPGRYIFTVMGEHTIESRVLTKY